ncbi:MAG TPA: exopolysaccharide Pel transporter PelG [Rectinemataceae bacterium]|nr:exopolysaccharide Pel transporter PelG [Rectinemataceae bacterium]
MAGIGFELRRLIDSRTIRGFVGAAFSGTLIVAGPWLVSTASIAAIQRLPFLTGSAAAEFTGAMVWVFALSLCLTTGPLYVFVRHSADLVYERRHGEAAMLLIKTAALVAAVSLPAGWLLSLALVASVASAGLFRLGFALLFAAVNVLWAAMMTATVMRRPTRILGAYAFGMALMYALARLLGPGHGSAGALIAAGAGFALTAALLVAMTVSSLGLVPYKGALRELGGYLRRYGNLAAAGAAYAIGIWVDKIVLWFVIGSAAPGTRFLSYSPYDTAFYYANLALIPGLIFYTLFTETDFHLDLTRFLVFAAHRQQPDIERARSHLARNAAAALRRQLLFQFVIAAILALMAPELCALWGVAVQPFLVLIAAGILQLSYVSALNMLFYLELYRDAARSAFILLATNVIVSLVLALGRGQWAVLPDGLSFFLANGLAAIVALRSAFAGLGRYDRLLFLRASGQEYGL